MVFYRIDAIVENSDALPEQHDRATVNSFSGLLTEKSESVFQKHNHQCYIFGVSVKNGKITLGAILKTKIDIHTLIYEYQRLTNLLFQHIDIEEITFKAMYSLLSTADRADYIKDDDEILEYFDLKELGHRRSMIFCESFVDDKIRKDMLLSEAKNFFVKDTLSPEIERIYAGKTHMDVKGHPVHYIVRCNNRENTNSVCKVLLNALYDNGRIESRRYVYADLDTEGRTPDEAYEAIYKSSEGGAIILRYTSSEDDEISMHARPDGDALAGICDIALKYRNKVLTIFCLPDDAVKQKESLLENLDNISLIELTEDVVSGDCAKDHLKLLAKSNHIRCDKSLFKKIDNADTGFSASDLKRIFENWYDIKLRTSVYPQYKETKTVKAEIQKEKPKGKAIDVLNHMIGLSDAKAVITKALNYYKIQKLYKSKGFSMDRPAMHMVFSGNPGTAKTTVARLFAQIMKDNGLLSKGDLYEVGRADLVGKYIGWTAQIVKEKFKAARGSVLFIDEAYSLSEDKDGLYGDEAINTIVQEMENNRENMVVIFAGYPDKMEQFLQRNPGMRSRIAFHVPFQDYSTEELSQIVEMISASKGMTISAEAAEKLKSVFDIARKQKDFGNGRYVRTVLEKAIMNQASRILDISVDAIRTEEILTLEACDIDTPTVSVETKRCIGF